MMRLDVPVPLRPRGGHGSQIVGIVAQWNADYLAVPNQHGSPMDRVRGRREYGFASLVEVGEREERDDLIAPISHDHVLALKSVVPGQCRAQISRRAVRITVNASKGCCGCLDRAR